MSKACPCGTNKNYTDCCGLYLGAGQNPPTPEALMRSRYTAFKRGRTDYIAHTQAEKALDKAHFNAGIHWLKLEILRHEPAVDGQTGIVEFKAHYLYRGHKHVLHEISSFRQEQGRWMYVAGEIITNCCPGH
jgi:SEC-C motif-containing protein